MQTLQESREDFTLTVSAKICGTRHVVKVCDSIEVRIPNSRFITLLILIRARFHKSTGFASVSAFDVDSKSALHQSIRRLRKDFNEALGFSSGVHLIRHVGRSAYELAVQRSAIHVMPEIRELAPDHIPLALANDIVSDD